MPESIKSFNSIYDLKVLASSKNLPDIGRGKTLLLDGKKLYVTEFSVSQAAGGLMEATFKVRLNSFTHLPCDISLEDHINADS